MIIFTVVQQVTVGQFAWVSGQEQVSPSQVSIAAMDRRLKVPSCVESFSFSFLESADLVNLQGQMSSL